MSTPHCQQEDYGFRELLRPGELESSCAGLNKLDSTEEAVTRSCHDLGAVEFGWEM